MQIAFQPNISHPEKYRPEIDGLRAIAILPVVFYHAEITGFTGGFVGVDIFFVISGYLITSIIYADIAQKKFSFAAFYERRMRRIFPALFAMAAFSIVAAAILFPPESFVHFGRSLMAMTGFVSNLYFMKDRGSQGYFDVYSGPQALLHTWSLSVEEQFYILLPVTLVLLDRFAKRLLVPFLALAAAASFYISISGVLHQSVDTFYMFTARSWELLIGALLAVRPPPLNSRVLREGAGMTGMILIAAAVYCFDLFTRFPGINALFPCLGAFLAIWSCGSGPSLARRILSFPPLVFIGLISYSLYLWHWPVIVFGKYFLAGRLGMTATVLALLVSFAAAVLSFEFIETPFRSRNSKLARKNVFALGIAASIICAAAGYAITSHDGFAERYGPRTRQLVLLNEAARNDYVYSGSCANFQKEIRGIGDIDFCEIGPEAGKKIMFWGDSHVEQLYSLVKKIHANGELRGRGVIFAIASGCSPVLHMDHRNTRYHCSDFSRFALMRAEKDDVETVYIGFTVGFFERFFDHGRLCASVNGRCTAALTYDEAARRFLDELSGIVSELRKHGKRVVVSVPFPSYYEFIPDVMIHNAMFGGILGDKTPTLRISARAQEQVAKAATEAGATLFDPRKSLCGINGCLYQKDGVSIYKDGSHIRASQIGIIEKDLVKSLFDSP